jgi:hypothetical protein
MLPAAPGRFSLWVDGVRAAVATAEFQDFARRAQVIPTALGPGPARGLNGLLAAAPQVGTSRGEYHTGCTSW